MKLIRHFLPCAAFLALFCDALAEENAATIPEKPTRTLGVLLFPGFEMLDACGPMEIWGNVGSRIKLVTVAKQKGEVATVQGPRLVAEYGFAECPPLDLLMIPGGAGVLGALRDPATLAWIKERSATAEITMSICNGATVLGACGLLDGRSATTNKQYWALATKAGQDVKWMRHARWVDDGNLVTSSGVSAGMDMTLHVIKRLFGTPEAERQANTIEYEWHPDASWDPFADLPPTKGKK